jgi:DNA-binding NarL/FixJ family response regulator
MFNILIVEDNLFFAQALHDALRSRFDSAVVMKAGGLQEALARVHCEWPDVIFVDLSLPDGNGLQLIRRLRAAGVDAAVCMLTSHDVPEYREEALRSGADHFMVKGSTPIGDIYGAVESALALRLPAAHAGRAERPLTVARAAQCDLEA